MGTAGLVSYCLVLPWLTQAAVVASEGKRSEDCIEKCGNVSILYPFGVGKGCYFPNSWFEVTCNESSEGGRKKPYLKRLKLEILYCYTDSNRILVNNPVFYLNCGNNNSKSVITGGAFTSILAESPFSFPSDYNYFGSAGNGNLATIFSDQIPMSGCLQPGDGNGEYCYIVNIPENLTSLAVNMTQIIPGNRYCSSAFIFDLYAAYYSDIVPRINIDIETRNVPARLEWNTTGLRCDLGELEGEDCKDDTVVCSRSRCGDVSIEFPFGIKAGCYMNEWHTSRQPFKTYSKCTNASLGFSVNLTGSPFFFSSANCFAFVGCGSLATFFGNRTNPIGGCLQANCSDGTSSLGVCYDLSIPSNMGSFAANMTQIYPSNGSTISCPSAFIYDSRYTDHYILNATHVPSTLQFGMPKSGLCELKEGSHTNCSYDGKYCWTNLTSMHLCVCTYDKNNYYDRSTDFSLTGYSIDVCTGTDEL
ncbi:hypothetical protein COLO4_33860 [Corchorus olitorius]|uniref:Wall-associated receptor kinase galacturonan-binding domain-containing protein n=1 Tax=Corchorus olitorius TaxID=93759 RepID=A0A1R3GQD5_9ROSI|nr:hypothetical protein COLO4_33860 [Corchorus olitorius]